MTEITLLIQHHAGPTGDVLVCQLPGGGWELPKGYIRVNETPENAVVRTAWETLGIQVKAGKLIVQGRKYRKDGTVEHIPCGNITHNTHTKCDEHWYYEAIDTYQTEPNAGAYAAFQWVHPSELGLVELTGDDKAFLDKYDPWINGRTIPDVRMY